MKQCDVLVVGGGPAGSYLASKLAENSVSVSIIDKKNVVGKQACSGLISTRINDFIDLNKKLILNKIKGARFYSPCNSFDLVGDSTKAYVVDRVGFDRFILKMATDRGACFFNNTCYKSHELCSDGVIVRTSNSSFKCKLLVGADGACSRVRENAGLVSGVKRVYGVVGRFSLDGNDGDVVELHYGDKVTHDFFGWKIPRGSDVEIGLASAKNHMDLFRNFVKCFGAKISSGQIHAYPINFGIIKRSVSERVALVGDAASQVKPFSGGGIIYGLICADILAEVISSGDYSYNLLLKYEMMWKKKLEDLIKKGFAIRHMLDSLDDCELDEFFRILSQAKRDILEKGDMDFL